MTNIVIICVDDETTVLRSIRDQLKRHFGKEYIIEIAERAEEALEIISELSEEEQKVAIVISDWLMPGMKGDEFLIHVHKKNPQTIKVLLTGQADQSAIINAHEHANLYKCIFKPWDEHQLVEIIQSGLTVYNSAAPSTN